MSDADASIKWDRTVGPASKSGDSASAKSQSPLRKTTGWTPGLSRAEAIKIAQSTSGIYRFLRGVLGRRRPTTRATAIHGRLR